MWSVKLLTKAVLLSGNVGFLRLHLICIIYIKKDFTDINISFTDSFYELQNIIIIVNIMIIFF